MNTLAATMRAAVRFIRHANVAAAAAAIRNKLRLFSSADESVVVPQEESSQKRRSRSTFKEAYYTGATGTRRYRVYIPGGDRTSPLPLLVMLHGCKQTPEDFALGTGMNKLAASHRFVVAYPEQPQSANGWKCWNWFKTCDQHRDRGEPAIIAGITRELIHTYGLDAKRAYVAGLSAGGAMAVVMGRTYPDLYAAIGVHSGIPYGAAHDAPSAFDAMKGAASRARSRRSATQQVIPAIVLHGDNDETVHPSNGKKVAVQFSPGGELAEEVAAAPKRQEGDGDSPVREEREYTRTLLRDKGGKVVVEHWLVHGAGHAWFGGNPRASHTDPKGPNASRELLRFFLEHELASGAR